MRALVRRGPKHAFGQARVVGRNISVAVILDRLHAGESVEEVAKDYSLTREQVVAAAHYELGRLERHAGKTWRDMVADPEEPT